MTEDTFCTYCMVIAAKNTERGKAALAKDEKSFARNEYALKKMIERFKKEIRDEST